MGNHQSKLKQRKHASKESILTNLSQTRQIETERTLAEQWYQGKDEKLKPKQSAASEVKHGKQTKAKQASN